MTFSTTAFCPSAQLSIKKTLLTKALHKNPQQEEVHPIALGTAFQYNLHFISQQTRLFNIPHHKWNIFCALPDELVSALWFDSRVLLLHLHAKHTDETATYHQVTAVVIHQGFMLSAKICIINPDEVPAASLCIAWNDINSCIWFLVRGKTHNQQCFFGHSVVWCGDPEGHGYGMEMSSLDFVVTLIVVKIGIKE